MIGLLSGLSGREPASCCTNSAAFQVGEDVDGALEQFQPGSFGGLAVELLARKKLSPVVIPAAGAAHAGEAVQPADHVAALGRADENRQGFARVVEQ